MTRHVRIISTGGTIASTGGTNESTGGSDSGTGERVDSGKTPTESGEALLEAVPELESVASIDVVDVCQVSGFQMDFERAASALDACEQAGADGVDGVVVTHGTDTMAETAYYADSVLETDVPVVFTGSQRSFDQLGTDGPTNLLAAVETAADERFRDAGGSYLAFNDTVHAARDVVKGHTSKLETFVSPERGPIAGFAPNGLRLLREPGRYAPQFTGERIDPDTRIELITNGMGVDGTPVERALESGTDGIVVAGTGLGNTTEPLGTALESALADGVPVVLTSRCHAGTTAGVYGGDGGAKTLVNAGAVRGGDLPPWKARLTLALSMSTGRDVSEVFDGIDSLV